MLMYCKRRVDFDQTIAARTSSTLPYSTLSPTAAVSHLSFVERLVSPLDISHSHLELYASDRSTVMHSRLIGSHQPFSENTL